VFVVVVVVVVVGVLDEFLMVVVALAVCIELNLTFL